MQKGFCLSVLIIYGLVTKKKGAFIYPFSPLEGFFSPFFALNRMSLFLAPSDKESRYIRIYFGAESCWSSRDGDTRAISKTPQSPSAADVEEAR